MGIDIKNAPPGEARINFSRKDVKVNIENKTELSIKAIIDRSSFEWIRVSETLLVPRVRVKIRISNNDSLFHIKYKETSTSFQQSRKASYAELYYSLYEKESVKIFQGDNLVASINLKFNNHKKERFIIDYTCSRNNIQITGLTNEHFSVGCHTRRIGSFGKEKPMLEIKWISPELKIIGSDFVPYQAAFLNKRPVIIKVLNVNTNEEK